MGVVYFKTVAYRIQAK